MKVSGSAPKKGQRTNLRKKRGSGLEKVKIGRVEEGHVLLRANHMCNIYIYIYICRLIDR